MELRIVRPSDEAPTGGGNIRGTVIEDGSHTSHRISIVRISVPASPASPPQHIHEQHDEIFIVTRGRLRFTTGDQRHDVAAGDTVIVPAGAPHTFANPFDTDAEFINTFTPDFYIHYFEDLAQLPVNDQGTLQLSEVARTMARYATHPVPPMRTKAPGQVEDLP